MYNIIVTYYHVMALTQRWIIGILCILNALSHININDKIHVLRFSVFSSMEHLLLNLQFTLYCFADNCLSLFFEALITGWMIPSRTNGSPAEVSTQSQYSLYLKYIFHLTYKICLYGMPYICIIFHYCDITSFKILSKYRVS